MSAYTWKVFIDLKPKLPLFYVYTLFFGRHSTFFSSSGLQFFSSLVLVFYFKLIKVKSKCMWTRRGIHICYNQCNYKNTKQNGQASWRWKFQHYCDNQYLESSQCTKIHNQTRSQETRKMFSTVGQEHRGKQRVAPT